VKRTLILMLMSLLAFGAGAQPSFAGPSLLGTGIELARQAPPEMPLFVAGGTPVSNGFFFPGTAVVNGKDLVGEPYEIKQGTNLRFVNLDPAILTNAHAIVSKKTDRRGRPLFKSKLVPGPGEATVVTSKLKPGTYVYYCPIHYGMFGKLRVTR
jgi:plastocyanin